jgi:hypothetical protein
LGQFNLVVSAFFTFMRCYSHRVCRLCKADSSVLFLMFRLADGDSLGTARSDGEKSRKIL